MDLAGDIYAFLGGILGIFIVFQLLWDNKKLPDATKMHAYEPLARKHGKIILA